jgi:hypothetical protein
MPVLASRSGAYCWTYLQNAVSALPSISSFRPSYVEFCGMTRSMTIPPTWVFRARIARPHLTASAGLAAPTWTWIVPAHVDGLAAWPYAWRSS